MPDFGVYLSMLISIADYIWECYKKFLELTELLSFA